MKKNEVRKVKEIRLLKGQEIEIPKGWELIKEPTKITENGNDFFGIVIGKSK